MHAPSYATGSCGVTHVDEGLLRYFHEAEHLRSLLDVGCGPGGQVQAARRLGWRALGIEVDPEYYRAAGVALADLCVQPLRLPARADLVWSVEVAEHVPPEHCDAYLDALAENARHVIVMTASQMVAPLHVNVQPVPWWVARMARRGWLPDPDAAAIIRGHSTMAREFLRETGMIFRPAVAT